MDFDPIASPTTAVSEHRERVFVHDDDLAVAAAKLGTFTNRHGGKVPNVLVVLMDDVGWGDFGCYGGGVAVGAATPHIDALARRGKLLTSAYSEPTCTPSRATLLTGRIPMRHGLQRPPMYGEPGGLQGEITLAELLGAQGYVTQCVGKWHLGENRESQPQHVGFDDFYGFLSVSDMYSEWRDPAFFPEIVYSRARTEWIENQPFNKCFVHATRGGDVEEVEEVTIPVLSELDEKWCSYSEDFLRRMAAGDRPWLLYHNTRGAHFDNYPHQTYLGSSPAKHPYKDTIIELDDIVGRLVAVLEETGQLDDTLVMVTSDNGPNTETWPDAAYTPFRCSKGSTWEGGVRVPFVVAWPGMIDVGSTDGIVNFSDILPTVLSLAGAPEAVPDDRFVDGVDQASFLLAPEGRSNRKYHYYWLGQSFSGLRCGEYKLLLNAVGDDPVSNADVHGAGGLSGTLLKFPYGRLYNLYLDPKETHSYMIRKLAYQEAIVGQVRNHLMTFRDHPAKLVVGINV